MKIGESVNEFGTPISEHFCLYCWSSFTVCPPAGDDWGGCQSPICPSYDPKRDVDRFFEE